jgi:hypothetical protein
MEYLVTVLLLMWGIEKAQGIFAGRAARVERERLYSRLQAGTLQDYAALRAEAERPPASVHRREPVPTLEEVTALTEDIPDGALVEARDAYRHLAGDSGLTEHGA